LVVLDVVACAAAGLRLTPGKCKGAAAAAGASGGRRLFGDGSGSDSDGEYSGHSDADDDNYKPDLHHLSGRGKVVLSKRKRHGQLPGATADKVRSTACRQSCTLAVEGAFKAIHRRGSCG
jgi:hypothetical protein